jgi:hypothetical protein
VASVRQPKKRTLSPKVTEPLREFLDACVIPALVDKYFDRQKEKKS